MFGVWMIEFPAHRIAHDGWLSVRSTKMLGRANAADAPQDSAHTGNHSQ